MLSHIHLSSVRPGRVPSSSKSGGTFRPAVRCAAVAGSGTGKRQQGWHWPLGGGQRAAENDDDAETEIVYVTDTAEADEVIEEEEPDQVEISAQHDQQAAAARTSLDLIQRHQPVVSTPPAPSDDQYVPEPAAAALTQQQASQQHHYQQQQQGLTAPHTTVASNAVPPRPAFASSSLSAAGSSSYWATSAGGWVVAMSLLIAVRQGRSHADAARLNVRALQARQQDSRVQGRALKEKRAQYLQQEQLLKEEAAAKRLAEKAREAEKARREAAAKAAEYELTAREELDRFRAKRAAAKKAFEESQGKLDEELATRTAREIALREEAEAKKAAEEAERRAAAAAEAARAAAEAAAAADAAEKAAREAAAARAALKQQLRNNSYKYALKLQGTAAAAPLTAGGRQPQLSVTLTLLPDVSSSSSSSQRTGASAAALPPPPPPVARVDRVYDSPDAATEGAAALAVQAAQLVYTHYVFAVTEGVVDLDGLSVSQQNANSSSSSSGSSASSSMQQQQEEEAGEVKQAEGSSPQAAVMLSEADNMLWRLLLLAKVEAAGRQAIGQVAPLAASGKLQQDFQAQSCYSALPQSEPNSLQQRLQQCADLVTQQLLPAAIQLLDDIIQWQLEDFTGADLSSTSSSISSTSSLPELMQGLVSSSRASTAGPASPYLVPACVYVVLLNLFDAPTQLLNRRSKSSSVTTDGTTAASPDASRANSPDATATADEELFDAMDDQAEADSSAAAAAAARLGIVSTRDSPLQRLAKFQLEALAKAAPADELTPVAVCLQQLLGRRHPVAAAMQLLAERNMSPGARQARALRQQQKQLAMATELLKDSPVAGPGGLDPQGARMRQQLVPAPERIWALRNVANSMLRSTASSGGGGSSSSSTPSAEEAVSMLKQASDLAAEHYGKNNPGCLSALLDYVNALLAVPGHQQEAKAAIEAVCGIVAAVGERYRQQKDLLSLVLLYESTQAALDVPEIIGRECVAMTRLQRQAADAFGVLETAQANMIMSKRKLSPGSASTALKQLARDCTEQLGGYVATKKRDTRLDQWNKGLPLAPLR